MAHAEREQAVASCWVMAENNVPFVQGAVLRRYISVTAPSRRPYILGMHVTDDLQTTKTNSVGLSIPDNNPPSLLSASDSSHRVYLQHADLLHMYKRASWPSSTLTPPWRRYPSTVSVDRPSRPQLPLSDSWRLLLTGSSNSTARPAHVGPSLPWLPLAEKLTTGYPHASWRFGRRRRKALR